MFYKNIILANTNIGVRMNKCNSHRHDSIKDRLMNCGEYNNQVEVVSKTFSLLGDKSRMKILLALLEGELCVYHICEITGAKQSATSQHLKKLKDGKIVKARKEFNQVLYSIADEHVASIIKAAIEHKDC